jgi:16S rRNA (uracil1498-N3)-methyltransferase
LQAYHPVLNPAITYAQLIQQQTTATKLIAHCIDDAERSYIKDLVQPFGSYLMLIGPEGDFSPQEITSALQQGFAPVTLGITRLRTETAALAACFELNYINR